MADGQLKFELIIDAQKGLASISGTSSAANSLAESMGRVSSSAEKAGKAINAIPAERLKMLGMMLGGAAISGAATALQAGGYDKAADYTKAAGNRGRPQVRGADRRGRDDDPG